jgi:rhodanese-related sulfurtransferase
MTRPREVRLHSHACLALEGETETLLTDPWLFGDVFNGAWSLCAPPDLEAIDWGRVRHVWISHPHPDHLHVPSLRLVRARAAGRVTAYCRRERRAAVAQALAELGFEVVTLAPHEETRIASDISGTLFVTGIDSALVLRLGERVVLNQNDCSLTRDEVRLLRERFPRLDAWFFQFSLGGYSANADDLAGLQAARAYHLEKVARYWAALRPRIFVPFASFFSFAKEGNAYLNDWAVTPAELLSALPHLPTQVLWSGDAVLWEGWDARNRANRDRWEEVLRGPRPVTPHAPVGERELEAAGHALVQEVSARGLRVCAPGETHLRIRETGRVAVLDCRRGRFELRDEAEPGRLAVIIPGDELLYFLRSPHGASIYFGSCFHVVDPDRWRRLRGFREALPLGLTQHLFTLARARLTRLDRRFLGGRLRSAYVRLGARHRPLDA